MTQNANIDSTTFKQDQALVIQRYGVDAVDFGTKYTSNIKDAYKNDEPWAVAIIEAERTRIAQPKYLNPKGFGKNSLYGIMHVGLRVTPKLTSPDPTVRETLQLWARNLNHDFAPMKSYTPEQLAQRASDLQAVVAALTEGLNDLAASAEIGNDDIATWRKIIEGLESYQEAAEQLRQVITNGPGVEVVYLDVDPKRH